MEAVQKQSIETILIVQPCMEHTLQKYTPFLTSANPHTHSTSSPLLHQPHSTHSSHSSSPSLQPSPPSLHSSLPPPPQPLLECGQSESVGLKRSWDDQQQNDGGLRVAPHKKKPANHLQSTSSDRSPPICQLNSRVGVDTSEVAIFLADYRRRQAARSLAIEQSQLPLSSSPRVHVTLFGSTTNSLHKEMAQKMESAIARIGHDRFSEEECSKFQVWLKELGIKKA